VITKRRIAIAGGILALVLIVALAVREGPLPVEMAQAETRTVRAYISEDAKTRLDEDIVIDMPISGTVTKIALEEGDAVAAGDCVATVDTFGIEQQIAGVNAMIEQAKARITSVDVEKPKPEELASAELQVQQELDRQAIARRELAIAENNLADAEREYHRVQSLHESGALSQSQLDEADRAYKNARENFERATLAEKTNQKGREIADLASQRLRGSIDDNEFMRQVYAAEIENLESQVRRLQDDLHKATITSPVDGVILEKFIEDSRVMAAGSPLLRIGDMSTIEIECDVLSEEVGRVSVGDPVEITGKALNDEIIMGKVKRIYPAGFKKISSLGIEQQRVRTIFEFDNTAAQLRPGTSVDVRIITDEVVDAVAVPERATFRKDGGWAVFVVEDGEATLTPVEIALKNDDWAAILSGLTAGQTIVAEPKTELEDGMSVSPLS
jgi:HlyD family secretion protein